VRRRRLLAAVGTAAVASVAGCGYAPAGGEVRRTGNVGPSGGVGLGSSGTSRFVVRDDRVVGVANGRYYVFRGDDPEFVDGARLAVADRDGSRRWGYVHRSEARSLAVGEAVYLLDEASAVVSVGPTEVGTDESTETEITERWRVRVVDAEPPLVADGGSAYVAATDGVIAVRGGATAWRRSFSGTVENLWPFDGGLLVRTGEALVALDGDGRRRWRRAVVPGATVAVEADRGVVVADAARGIGPDGTVDWRLSLEGSVRSVVGTDGRVAVAGPRGTVTVDAADGTRLWSSGVAVRPSAAVVGPEALYAVVGDSYVVAIDGTGRRWSRTLEDDEGSGEAVGGWLDGGTVAFLFGEGDVVWLQRAEQDRGLL